MKILNRFVIDLVVVLVSVCSVQAGPYDRSGTQWYPFLEWEIENPTIDGNPYDVIASVTFVHTASGETRTTGMFYDSNSIYKFRFTGTLTGEWTFTSSSSDPELNGIGGIVTITAQPDSVLSRGFITSFGNRWGRTGTGEAFVPQFVMYAAPVNFYQNPSKIDADIQTFLVDHGFSGFHVMGTCHWFDITKQRSTDIDVPNPDPRTFEALEMLITRTYENGGVVHLWMWGDESRKWTPKRWGLNGDEDKRLQRYVAARLGPLPGWSMGYGFDVWEWANENDLAEWHAYLQNELGWTHYLGARSEKNELTQLYEGLDYSSYEQHKPNYDMYVQTIEARPEKPSFSEDRFRIRGTNDKDYSMGEVRRGLWHSTMAGGVANIWGNLEGGRDQMEGSKEFPNPEWIKTYARFFDGKFSKTLVRDNAITDGVCLRSADRRFFIFYKENASSVQMDLGAMAGPQSAKAVDTKGLSEVLLGEISPENQVWNAPYPSDWAIFVGLNSYSGLEEPNPPRGMRISR